jgi:Dolichyl-phosphate-mannose-protein mannosyltransferase
MTLYYCMLRAWVHIGDSEFMLRLPSMILGVLTVVATYALAARLFGRLTGLVAAALLSVHGFHIAFSRWPLLQPAIPAAADNVPAGFRNGIAEYAGLDAICDRGGIMRLRPHFCRPRALCLRGRHHLFRAVPCHRPKHSPGRPAV